MAGSLHKILFVEDSKELQIVVCGMLKKKYLVHAVATMSEATELLAQQTFSLIILDVGLPDGDGFKICSQIKLTDRHRHTPVIFLSGMHQPEDKVMGLSLGADDYIAKPFEPLEFLARIDARIRSVEGLRSNQENICIGNFRIVPGQQKVFLTTNSEEISLDLTTMEFKLLYYLLRHEDRIFSRNQILDEVWGQLANVTDRTVDTHIYTIRQKLGSAASQIQAIPRVGYRYSQTEKRSAA